MITVVGYCPKGLAPLQTDADQDHPQEIYFRFMRVHADKGIPQTLMVLRNGNENRYVGTNCPPDVVATYHYGVDYFEQVSTLDEITATITNWLSNADANELVRVFREVTGVTVSQIIGDPKSENAKIAFNMPS